MSIIYNNITKIKFYNQFEFFLKFILIILHNIVQRNI